METTEVDVSVKQHHVRSELCVTRARYREGRHLKAVKVYTVNQESKYLLIQGVPSVGAHEDLIRMFASYGHLEMHKFLDEYPTEKFSEVLLVKYKQIQAARLAKRKLDDFNFYGGTLHVCYAPEYENVQDTREKLEDRRKAISARIRKLEGEKLAKDDPNAGQNKKISKPESRHSDANNRPDPIQMEDNGWQHSKDNFTMMPSSIQHTNPNDNNNHTSESHATSECLQINSSVEKEIDNADLEVRDSVQSFTPSNPNMFPSQNQDYFRGPNALKSAPARSRAKPSDVRPDGLVVKDLHQKSARTPKFVPRQVNRGKTFVKKTGERQSPEKTSDSEKTQDPVNERLRSEALTLGQLAGPELPPEEKELRKSFKRAATTGDEELEKTAIEIREKVQKFSQVAVPLQVKKKRRK